MTIKDGTLGNCDLVFSAVSRLTVPRAQTWGASVSINAFRETEPGKFEIEMQSGDVIAIRAESVTIKAAVL